MKMARGGSDTRFYNLTFPLCCFGHIAWWLPSNTPWKCCVLKRLQAHISEDCSILGHCEGVCTSGTLGCALVRGSPRDIMWGEGDQKSLIFMRLHGIYLGNLHEIWAKSHNGKARILSLQRPLPISHFTSIGYGAFMSSVLTVFIALTR